ncbi:MAG: PAS domain S-box protein, partial [Chloroflexi bacterium]
MSVKTPRKTKVKPTYKVGTAKKVRGSAPKTTSKSNGKYPLAVYEHLHIGIVEASLDGKYMDVNEEFCRILGYSKKELLRLGVRDCTHEDDYGLDIKLHEQLVAGKIPVYELEKRYVRKDGGIIWVELTRSLVRGANGEPLHTLGVVIDISDHKQVERALRESAENLRLATEAARMFKWEFNFQRQLYTFADNFVQVLGFSAGLLPQNSAQTVWRLSPAEDVQAISEAIANAIENHTDLHSLQYRMVNPENGQTVWLEVNGKIIYDEQGNARRMFGVAQNISTSKKAQEEIQIVSRMPAENPNPVMRLTPDGKILYANDASALLLAAWAQQVEQRIPAELHKAVMDTLASGTKTEVEIEHRGKIFSCTLAPIPESGYVNLYGKDITKRKRAEEKLRASEALYRAIASSIPGGGVYVVDKDFRYLVAEGPVTEAFGLSREMLEGHTVSEVFPDERGTRMEERLRRTFAGETISFETKHNGRVYWTQQAPLLDSIGQAIILTVDITERKQAEEALQQSEERFVRFMQHLPALAWIKDVEGRYVYANATAEKAFSTPREKLYGRTDLEIFSPEIAAQFRKNDGQALVSEKGMQTVEALRHADGTLRYSLVNKFPIPGSDGSTALIGGTAFDITERLRAEEALHESEQRLRAILNQATAGIVRKDADGKLIFVNQAFCNMLDYTESELLGKPIWQLTHAGDVDENRRLFDKLMLEGVPFKLEKRLIRRDGSIIWVDVSVSPIMDATGKPQSAVAVEVDITARKQAEEALQQLNLQLESRVQKRTATIQAMNQSLRDEIAERKRIEEALRVSEASARASEEKLRT